MSLLQKAGFAASILLAIPAGAEPANCFYDLAATRNYELGYAKQAIPTAKGDAVLYLRAGGPRDTSQHLYEYDLATHQERELVTPAALLGGQEETLSTEEKARRERARITAKGFTEFQLTEDGTEVMVPLSGRLYLLNRSSARVRTVPGEGWIAPTLSPDGKMLAAVKDGDIQVISLTDNAIHPLTSGASETLDRGTADFIAAEELDRQEGMWWSPDGAALAFEEQDISGLEPHFIANPQDPAQAPVSFRYPRTGTANARLRLGIAKIAGGPAVYARWDQNEFPYLARVVWPKQGRLTISVMNRDQTRLKLLAIDPATGNATELLQESDPAWINLGPDGGNGRSPMALPRWREDGSGFLWASERSGQWQLEMRKEDGSLDHKITPDGFRYGGLADLGRSDAIIAGGSDRLSSGLYRVALSGGEPKKLVDEAGLHAAEFGVNHAVFVHGYSLADGRRGVDVRQRDGKILAELPAIAEAPPALPNMTLLKVGAHQLDAALLRPHDFDAGRHYPVLLSVYAGPTVKNVTAAPRHMLEQQCMADQGFIVVTIDNRGTPGRDRAFERVIKGNLIDIALADQIEGLEALGALTPQMDMSRVGVYGWSFGGYFSAMATLRRGDIFKAGIAGAPVVDWQDYDTAYTERYLGQPKDNVEGYRRSNVLTYVQQLSSPLVLVHGVTDDNVYFEHSVKLTQALLAADKHYELILLPGTHQLPDPKLRASLELQELAFFRRTLTP